MVLQGCLFVDAPDRSTLFASEISFVHVLRWKASAPTIWAIYMAALACEERKRARQRYGRTEGMPACEDSFRRDH